MNFLSTALIVSCCLWMSCVSEPDSTNKDDVPEKFSVICDDNGVENFQHDLKLQRIVTPPSGLHCPMDSAALKEYFDFFCANFGYWEGSPVVCWWNVGKLPETQIHFVCSLDTVNGYGKSANPDLILLHRDTVFLDPTIDVGSDTSILKWYNRGYVVPSAKVIPNSLPEVQWPFLANRNGVDGDSLIIKWDNTFRVECGGVYLFTMWHVFAEDENNRNDKRQLLVDLSWIIQYDLPAAPNRVSSKE